jgi:hypothetical protein
MKKRKKGVNVYEKVQISVQSSVNTELLPPLKRYKVRNEVNAGQANRHNSHEQKEVMMR